MLVHPFLVARFVFFALLANLSLLILIFAAWNANVTVSVGLSVSATAVFLILNSCSALVFLTLGVADLLVPQARTSRLVFECCWSAGLSIFQTGAAISVSVNSPEICRNSSDWGLCASSYLLITTSWLSTLVASAYFFVIFFTTVAHSRVQAGIWYETVYAVHWFNESSVSKTSAKSNEHSESDFVSSSRPNDPESSGQLTDDHEKAPWAQISKIRRGVDMPFKIQGALPVRTSTSTTIISLPIVPPSAQGRDTVGSRFVEKFRESQSMFRSPTAMHGSLLMVHKDPFPSKVDDHDLPIPLPRLSEWIRADTVKGISVHTMPQSP